MTLERKISLDKYILAGFITLLIFSLGLTLGMIVDGMRLSDSEQSNKAQEINYQSLQLQFAYLSSLADGNASCPTLKVALDKSVSELGESLGSFEDFKEGTRINQADYELLGRKYLLDNIKYWFFAEKSRDLCHLNLVTVLYFYSSKDCKVCPDQGVLLTYFKKIFDERLLVFPMNVDLEGNEALVKILRTRYNITSYPSIVIQEKTYPGVVDKQELSKLICMAYPEKPIECERFLPTVANSSNGSLTILTNQTNISSCAAISLNSTITERNQTNTSSTNGTNRAPAKREIRSAPRKVSN